MFLPLAVSFGAGQLTADRKRRLDAFQSQGLDAEGGVDASLVGELQSCLDALRKIKSFNNLARDHLAVLESQEFGFGGL